MRNRRDYGEINHGFGARSKAAPEAYGLPNPLENLRAHLYVGGDPHMKRGPVRTAPFHGDRLRAGAALAGRRLRRNSVACSARMISLPVCLPTVHAACFGDPAAYKAAWSGSARQIRLLQEGGDSHGYLSLQHPHHQPFERKVRCRIRSVPLR